MLECPSCGSMHTKKDGLHKWTRTDGKTFIKQRFKCLNCGKRFQEDTAKRGVIVISAPKPMLADLFFEVKTFIQQSVTVRLRKGDVTIRELS